VKRSSKFAWLLGLFFVTCFIVFWRDQPAEETASIANPVQTIRPTLSKPVNATDHAQSETAAVETTSDKSSEEMTLVESSWAKELRELKALAAQDPDAALARVARMADKHERKSAAQSVCLVVAAKDPAKAMLAAWNNDLGKFTDESSESIAVETLAKHWAEADLAKAFVWASVLPPDDEARRDRVVKGIALALAQVAPAEAAAMVAKHIHPDSTVHIDAAIEVLRTWASQEYSGAMAWASLFPAGALRERSAEELANVEPAPSSATKIKTN
jgi:hypothetical protein